jgi:hypothetical protein
MNTIDGVRHREVRHPSDDDGFKFTAGHCRPQLRPPSRPVQIST